MAQTPDVAEDESAGAGCHSDVDSEGQLVIQCHAQVSYSLCQRHRSVLNVNGEVTDGTYCPWKGELLSLVEVELQLACRYPLRDFSPTRRDLCCCFRLRRRQN